MSSLPVILAWEIWRKNRWGFGAIVAALGLGALVRHVLFHFRETLPEPVIAINFSLMGFCYVAAMSIFSHTDSGRSQSFGFPSRMFTLPIPTGSLVTWLALFGMTLSVILNLIWTQFLLPPEAKGIPASYITLLSAAGAMIFQTIVWTLADSPRLRATAMLALAIGLIGLAPLPFRGVWPEVQGPMTVGLGIILPLGYCWALFGVERARHGHSTIPEAWQSAYERLMPTRSVTTRKFASPAQAQFWMEWRRNGRMPVLIYSMIMGIGTIFFILTVRQGRWGMEMAFLYFLMMVQPVLIMACLAGLKICNDGSSDSYVLSPFLGARPVSTGDLFVAKLKVAVASTLCTIGLALAFVLVWVFLSHRSHFLEQGLSLLTEQRPEALAIVCLAPAILWSLVVGGFPLWLTGRIPGFPWSLLVGLVCAIGLIRSGIWFYQNPAELGLLYRTLIVALVLRLGIAIWAFGESRRRELISMRVVQIYLGFWILGTLICIAVAYKLCEGTRLPANLFALLAAFLFPLARVALSPIALGWNRNR